MTPTTRLTSRELMERAGISRATLNNYIALGLLPRPEVMAPQDNSRARRIGFFPVDALDLLLRVRAMKDRGVSMDQIVAELGVAEDREDRLSSPGGPQEAAQPAAPAVQIAVGGPRLTLLDYEEPAYLVNGKFEIEW